jgi:hypothetical protein
MAILGSGLKYRQTCRLRAFEAAMKMVALPGFARRHPRPAPPHWPVAMAAASYTGSFASAAGGIMRHVIRAALLP